MGDRRRQIGPGHGHSPRVVVRDAFSLIEVLVVIALIVVLLALTLSAVRGSRRSTQKTVCMSQLRQIHQGFHIYADDHHGTLPATAPGGPTWERLLLHYVKNASMYVCPSDQEVAPMIGSSFDWRDTGDPSTTMAGRNLSEITRSAAVMTFETLPGWHGKGIINAGRFNGAVQSLSETACYKDLVEPLR